MKEILLARQSSRGRIIGDAGQKLEAPPIKAIYLGDNVQTVDAIKMESFCDKKRIILEKGCRD